MGEISAVWRGRGEKFVSDNSKCIGDPHGVGGGVNFQFPQWGKVWMFSGMTQFGFGYQTVNDLYPDWILQNFM